NTAARDATLVPFDCDAMRSVLGLDAKPRGKKLRTNFLQPDQADSGHADAVNQLGPKRRRQLGREDRRIHSVIDQDPPIDQAANDRNPHGIIVPGRAYDPNRRNTPNATKTWVD